MSAKPAKPAKQAQGVASPPRAYSYVRFSSQQQAEGGSLDRQSRLTADYCRKKNLLLDESLTLQDLGVSAFRGANVREGALAGFLEACRTGRVPRGAFLIVESLDRLSRDQIRPALQLFLALQDFGITIVTHEPPREYDPAATDALALIEPLIVFARAHEESMTKSHRRRDGWKQARDRARAGGGPMLKAGPAWLEVTPDGFQVKEEAAAAVRRIFAMARDGLGVYRITERLTRAGVPPIGSGARWVKAYVYRILTNPAAMGSYQPQRQDGKRLVPDGEPIPGYYPAIVTEDEWNQAQQAIRRRGDGRGAGRKGAEETNLFTGLLSCALTGSRLHIINALGRKGEGERKRYRYLTPSREDGAAKGERLDYAVFEEAVLSLLKELKPSDVIAKTPATGRQAEVERLAGRIADIDTRLDRVRQRAKTADDLDAFLDLMSDLQAERKQVSERLTELNQDEDDQAGASIGETKTLIEMLAQSPTEEREDLRRRLKGRIRQLVAEGLAVIVRRGRVCLCALQLWFRGGDRRRDYLIVHKSGSRHAEGTWSARSLAEVGETPLDLRKPAHARELANILEGLDVEELLASV